MLSALLFASLGHAESECPASFYKPIKFKSGGIGGISQRAITIGFDTWAELEENVKRGATTHFLSNPKVSDFSMEYIGIPETNLKYSISYFAEWLGRRITYTAFGDWWLGTANDACPPGYTDYGGSQCYSNTPSSPVCPEPDKNPGPPKDPPQTCPGDGISEGDPINSATGNHYEIETDYRGPNRRDLVLQRFYSSVPVKNSVWGSNWRSTFDRSVFIAQIPPSFAVQGVAVVRPDGKKLFFKQVGNVWSAASTDVNGTLVGVLDGAGATSGWIFTNEQDEVETYGPTGKLLAITDRSGYVQNMAYDPLWHLIQVTDSYGRIVSFSYTPSNDPYHVDLTVATVKDPSGRAYTHTNTIVDYAIVGSQVAYPDGRSRAYLYNESVAYPLNQNATGLLAMTGLIDENGQRFASWFYDTQGRAISSEHAGGVNKVSLTYNTDGTTLVSDARGISHVNRFATIAGNVVLTGKTQPAGSGCAATAKNLVYDAAGNATMRDNVNGSRTCSVYDAQNRETVRVEGLAEGADCSVVTPPGAALPSGARQVLTTWHSDWRLPLKVTEPLLSTTRVYNGQPDPFNGNAIANCTPAAVLPNGKPTPMLCKQVVQATLSDGSVNASVVPSVNSYSYDALNNLLSRTDPLGRVSNYTYYATTAFTGADPEAVGHTLGDLHTVTDPKGFVTTFNSYDKAGRVLQITDAKGIVTDMTYTPRGWVKTVSVTPPGGTARVTTYTYDNVGQVTHVANPDGTGVGFTYDAAHRLTGATDARGNSVTYTLDNMGNRIAEQLKDPGGVLQRTMSRSFDALNRVQQLQLQ